MKTIERRLTALENRLTIATLTPEAREARAVWTFLLRRNPDAMPDEFDGRLSDFVIDGRGLLGEGTEAEIVAARQANAERSARRAEMRRRWG